MQRCDLLLFDGYSFFKICDGGWLTFVGIIGIGGLAWNSSFVSELSCIVLIYDTSPYCVVSASHPRRHIDHRGTWTSFLVKTICHCDVCRPCRVILNGLRCRVVRGGHHLGAYPCFAIYLWNVSHLGLAMLIVCAYGPRPLWTLSGVSCVDGLRLLVTLSALSSFCDPHHPSMPGDVSCVCVLHLETMTCDACVDAASHRGRDCEICACSFSSSLPRSPWASHPPFCSFLLPAESDSSSCLVEASLEQCTSPPLQPP